MKNQIKTIVLLGSLSALIVGLGALVAPQALGMFAVLALVMNLGAYFFSDRIVLRMHGASEVTASEAPELHAIVEELAVAAAIPKPRVCVMPGEQPNAFATGRSPDKGVVAVTEGLLGLLDRRELRGVIAHELAHIKNRDVLVSSIAAAAASMITYIAQTLSFGAMFGGSSRDDESGSTSGTGSLAAIFVAPLAATLIQLGISRQREFLADETGARICGDPEALARALLKLEAATGVDPMQATPATASLFIVNPFGASKSISRWFSTHPDTGERVQRLRGLARSGRPNPASSPRPRLLRA